MTPRGAGSAPRYPHGALLLLALTVLAACAPEAPRRQLVEWGWDEPDTAFMRRSIGRMERTPFDGCVFHANLRRPDGRAINLAWRFWGREGFSWDEARAARDDLWHTPRSRFQASFLRLNVTPGDLDWYDDFSPVLANARLAARLVRETEVAGIVLDTETYERPIFDYGRQRHADRRSWDEYAAQTRLRGRELVHAFQQACPEITILLTFAYELPWEQSRRGPRPLAECRYGLLAPFVDGLIDGARGARLVAAHELSYGYRQPAAFDKAYERLRGEVLPIVSDPQRYREVVSIGFGLWLDRQWRRGDWSESDFSQNYFTPEVFERSLCAALRRSDRYVWIYSQAPRWWTKDGGPSRLPEPYVEAIDRARRCAGLPE